MITFRIFFVRYSFKYFKERASQKAIAQSLQSRGLCYGNSESRLKTADESKSQFSWLLCPLLR